MHSFRDKAAVITGAGSGIGRALALQLAEEGAWLALNDYDADTLAETRALIAEAHGHQPYTEAFDVSDRDAMFGFAEAVDTHLGGADLVFNNAGLSIAKSDFAAVSLRDFERCFDVNFRGVLYGSQAFVPQLLRAPEAALVNISSVFGLTGVAGQEAYVASKFAVNGLTQSLQMAYRDTNLRVTCVFPGGIATNIVANGVGERTQVEVNFSKKLLRHSPAMAARTILRGVRRGRPRVLIGTESHLLDLGVRLAPVFGSGVVNDRLQREVQ